MVLIPGDPLKTDVPSVDGDNYDGVRQAVEHLIQLGHREIAILPGPMNSKYSLERVDAFRRIVKQNALPFREDWLVEYDFTPDGAYAGMKKIISLGNPPTGLLLMNDFSAVGVVRAAEEMGYRVPEDLSIIGFGDIPLAAMTHPSLTTVREPFQEMGYQAADKLLKMIQGKRVSPKHVILPVELIIRKSTVPPPPRKGGSHDHEGHRQNEAGRWNPNNGCADSPVPGGMRFSFRSKPSVSAAVTSISTNGHRDTSSWKKTSRSSWVMNSPARGRWGSGGEGPVQPGRGSDERNRQNPRRCFYCQRGMGVLCESRLQFGRIGLERNGAMARFVSVPWTSVHRIPSGVSFEEAAMAEPAGVALGAVRRATITPGMT